MKAIHVRVPKMCAAAAAIAVATVVAGACTQQSAGDPARGSTPAAPTPVAGNVVVSDQRALTARGANTELVCHARGNGTFAPLWVNPNAVGAHLGHGDGRPLGQMPGGSFVFTSTCELVANVAGIWLGESITYDPNFSCGRDRNQYRLTLQQSGSDVSGEVYWKILESFYPPDVGMEQTAALTSANVSGNTFTFSYGPPQLGVVVSATFTGTTMTGTIAYAGPSCDPNTFKLVRQ